MVTSDNVTPLREPVALPRLPPTNIEAEQALLGAFLCNNRWLEAVADFLKPEHFASGLHARVLEAIQKLVDRGQIANVVTLKAIFDQDPALVENGGARYLVQLAAAGAQLLHFEDYARLVNDLWQRRQLLAIAEDIQRRAYSAELNDPAAAQIERAETQLYQLAEKGDAGSGFRPLAEVTRRTIEIAEAAYKRGAQIVGVPTGFVDLDKSLGGLHPSDLVILAGRTSMGKTALAVDIALNAAKNGDVVGVFSLEMADVQLGSRVLGGESGIASDWVRRADLNQQHFARLLEAKRKTDDLPLFIDDTPGHTVAALRSRARRLKRRHGLDLIVTDYLQLIQPTRGDGFHGSQQNRVQLSRAVENREDKRPLLSDLRESGSIEQDADVVLFIYRGEYYEREPPVGDVQKHTAWCEKIAHLRNQAEVIVAKQRHGPTGTVQLHFDHDTTRFSNLV